MYKRQFTVAATLSTTFIFHIICDLRLLLNRHNKIESLYLLNCCKHLISLADALSILFFEPCSVDTSLKLKPSLVNNNNNFISIALLFYVQGALQSCKQHY